MKRKLTCAILAGVMTFSASAFAADTVVTSGEGKSMYMAQKDEDILKSALRYNIIDSEDKNWDADITRGEFCGYIYNMINSVKELPVAKLTKNPFEDVMDYKTNTLAFSNIVSGKSEGIFAPDDKITRQEAAAILYRAAIYANADLPLAKVDMSYSDNADISDWAVSEIYGLKILNVIEDIDGKFLPNKNMDTESAVISITKLYETLKNINY